MSTVVFVGGSARSGSTLLGDVLGSQPGVFNAGELSLFWRDLVRGGSCTCGATIGTCPVWQPAIEECKERHGLTMRALQGLVDERARLSRSTATPQLLRMLHSRTTVPTEQSRTLVEATRTLVESVLSATGSTVIVDTSKLLPSLLFDQLISDDVRLVHLVRDPRGVAASFQRTRTTVRGNAESLPPGSGLVAGTARWVRANGLLAAGAGTAPVRVRVAYEDVVGSPEETVVALCHRLGIPWDPATVTGNVFHPSGQSHSAVGNPVRNRPGSRDLRPDERWREELRPWKAKAIAAATWPVHRLLRQDVV